MSLARPGRVTPREKDVLAGRRGEQYRPMEVIIENIGYYPIEWETRNRHTVGINKFYSIQPEEYIDEYADFAVLKFGDFRVPEDTPEWYSMLRRVAQVNTGGSIPFVRIYRKDEKGKRGELLWDGKEAFKRYINSQAGLQHLIGGKRLPIPRRIKKMNRKQLIELSIRVHFPLDCIEDDIARWSNVRIMRVLTTKCSPELLEEVLEMELDDYNTGSFEETEGEDDGVTLDKPRKASSKQNK